MSAGDTTGETEVPAAGPHQAYYAQARSWADDRQAELHRSRRLAWLLAGVGRWRWSRWRRSRPSFPIPC